MQEAYCTKYSQPVQLGTDGLCDICESAIGRGMTNVEPQLEQAMRHNTGKVQLSYVLDFPNAIAAFSRVCEFGANKYERHNWKKGLPVSKTMDSTLRHLVQFQKGEDRDDESKCLHLAHAMWNIMAMMETLEAHGTDVAFDDRN